MITLISTGAENVIGFSVNGTIETSDLKRVTQVIEEKLQTSSHLRIYAEIPKLEGISPEAILKDLQFAWQHLGDFGKFDKKAVVCEEGWMKVLVNISDTLFPNIAIKYFALAEKDIALSWAKV